jgi:hypothetical protein
VNDFLDWPLDDDEEDEDEEDESTFVVASKFVQNTRMVIFLNSRTLVDCELWLELDWLPLEPSAPLVRLELPLLDDDDDDDDECSKYFTIKPDKH